MRGDVVLLDFPFAEGGGSKVRPALIIQADDISSIHTIVAQITSARQRMLPSRLLVDPSVEIGSGLKMPSLIVCEQLYTIRKDRIIATLGGLSRPTMILVGQCIKKATGLT